ncbi:MAG TPA: sensor histidine kinase [Gemmatimonadales bacterium]|nr:sensor histidine kinase [Gemmatimonadales bacterium]
MPSRPKLGKRTSGDEAVRAASRRLLATGERDLQRIVLDMHDGPVQDLFAALSHLELVDRALPEDSPQRRRLQQTRGLLERALGEIRNFIGAFRPPGFERRSLGAVLEGLAVQHETLTDQVVEFEAQADLGDCPLAVKIALFRILQEALANGSRHSGASRQWVRIRREGHDVELMVADDGRGFDPASVLASEEDVGVEGGHFGLRGMQDRVALLGGRFRLESAPGEGTTVRVRLPVT